MTILDRKALLGRSKVRSVTLPDGAKVHIRPLSAAVIHGATTAEAEEHFAARAVQASVCDADGTPLFEQEEDFGSVLQIPLSDFKAIMEAIIAFNGLDNGETGTRDRAEKN